MQPRQDSVFLHPLAASGKLLLRRPGGKGKSERKCSTNVKKVIYLTTCIIPVQVVWTDARVAAAHRNVPYYVFDTGGHAVTQPLSGETVRGPIDLKDARIAGKRMLQYRQ